MGNFIMSRKVALCTGITGQDGSYLAELLLERGYEVHGILRRSSSINTSRIDHIFDRLSLHYGDVTDGSAISNIINSYSFDEIYHLAAQSHVKVSFEMPEYTAIADGLSTLKLLETIRIKQMNEEYNPVIYNACTSEMFGSSPAPQNERTPFNPCSPYGTAKLYSYWIARNYRESYNMNITNGILFNHESPRRGETFVTRKVCKAAVRIAAGLQDHLYIGNIEAKRDWGHAEDYVRAMHDMVQYAKNNKARDFVIATGESYSVKYLINYAFSKVGITLQWPDKSNVAVNLADGKPLVYYERTAYNRPNEVMDLRGDPSDANKILGWYPHCTFYQMIDEIIAHEKIHLSA